MTNVPTETKLWYIEYPVRIDGVTDEQVQEWALHCALWSSVNTETTDEDGYPIYEFQSYVPTPLIDCVNRMRQPEGLPFITEDDLSFRMVPIRGGTPTLIAPSGIIGGFSFNDETQIITVNQTGQQFPYGTNLRKNRHLLWANTEFQET